MQSISKALKSVQLEKLSLLFRLWLLFTLMNFPVIALEGIGHAQTIKNKVFAGGLNHRLEKGEAVKINDKVITGENSAATLKLIDGSIISIGSDTRIVLNKLGLNNEQTLVSGKFFLLSGAINFTSGGIQMRFNLDTPNASISVIGTSFDVLTSKQKTEVLCREGSVLVKYEGGEEVLESGQVLLVRAGGESQLATASTSEMTRRISEMLSLLDQVTVVNKSGNIKKSENFIATKATSTLKKSKLETIKNRVMKKNLEMELRGGIVKIRLREDLAPEHVKRIKKLVTSGFYDGLEFFNVKPGYVVESGSPKNSFQIGSGRRLMAEFSGIPFTRGTVGMSRLLGDPDSADSQFFITLGRVPGFDNKYTVWGEVVSGIKVLENLAPGSPPKNPDKIFKVRLVN